MKRIDFRKGEVVFADASMGASALQASQLYWQAGSRRLHDWWVADGSTGRPPMRVTGWTWTSGR